MARDITITFEDGSTHVYKNAPDTVTPEQVTARASEEFGKGVKALDGGKTVNPATETGKVIGKSLYGGLTALPRLVMEGGNWLESKMPTPEWSKIPIPGYGAMAEADASINKALQPETPTGKVVAALGEGVVGAVAGPGGVAAPIRSAITGASAAGGSELFAKLFGDNAVTRILGGLAGGLTGGIATAAKTNRNTLAQEALQDVRPQDLQVAVRRMEEARAAGIPINLSQAMPRGSNIDAYADALANSRHGRQITEQLRNQPGQIVSAGQARIGTLPGEVLPTRIMANEAQEGATAAIDFLKRNRTNAWEKAYKEGLLQSKQFTVPQTAVAAAYQKLGDLAATVPNTSKAKMLEDLRGRLITADGFITDPLQLNEILKDAAGRLKPVNLATSGLDAGAAKWIGKQINALREDFGEAFVPIGKANEAYKRLTPEIESVKKSITGDIAGRHGALSDVNAPQGKLFALFDKGTSFVPGQAKRSEILTLERDLRRAGQEEVFLNAGKTWIADKFAKVLGPGEAGGRAPEHIAENLMKVFGNPRTAEAGQISVQAQGFDDLLAGMARSQGVPEASYVKGFKNFMKIVSDASRRPRTVRGVTPGEVKEMASEGLFRRLGQVSVMTPIRQPALKWAQFLEADSLRTMDKLLTTPEGVATLVKLGKQPPYSHAAVSTMATFLGTTAGATGNEDPNSPGITPE